MTDTGEFFNLLLDELSIYTHTNPRDITIMSIGNNFRYNDFSLINDKDNQVLPLFARDIIKNTTKTIRMINIDPRFNLEFLDTYYDTTGLNLTYDDSDGMNVWRSDDHRIEIFVILENFMHYCHHYPNVDNHDWFFDKLVNSCLTFNNQLIVQEYTGNELHVIFTSLYNKSPNKELFKKKILFDVTYGSDCHCSTDLTKYKPYYDTTGDFYNITLFNATEMIQLKGVHPEIDSRIKKFFGDKYKYIVNQIHVDYRRKIQNIPFVDPKNRYTNESSPEDIMRVLYSEIMEYMYIFRIVELMTPEKEELVRELFQNYSNYTLTSNPSVYKWTDMLLSIAQ